ncbi:MAG TPA: hypothetical protein DFR83_00195 [Deltaproteobacteria bacterium]|nr:hypothetical protein [Deltaproteobacteria bacterium]|tara:strand:- start:38 stop:400 length:363 start_codon:yes stop_codon:yes gene_type:complete
MDPVLIFSLVMIALVAVKFRSFKLWDELTELIYTQHRTQWDTLGQPLGYFWRPDEKGISTFGGMTARRKLTSAWLSETPEWMAEDGPERVKLTAWRVTFWTSWGGIALVGAGLFVWQMVG